jgi:cellulose biosynthesis protein BcsQ
MPETTINEHSYLLSAEIQIWLTCKPSIAMTASTKVIVIVSPGYFELDSIVQIGKTITEVREYFNPKIQLAGFLFTMSDPTVNSKTSLQILRQTYTGTVFNTIIPRNTDLRDAHFERKDNIEQTLPDEAKLFNVVKNDKKVWVLEDSECFTILYPHEY